MWYYWLIKQKKHIITNQYELTLYFISPVNIAKKKPRNFQQLIKNDDIPKGSHRLQKAIYFVLNSDKTDCDTFTGHLQSNEKMKQLSVKMLECLRIFVWIPVNNFIKYESFFVSGRSNTTSIDILYPFGNASA